MRKLFHHGNIIAALTLTLILPLSLVSTVANAELRVVPAEPAQGGTARIEGISGCAGASMNYTFEGKVLKIQDPIYIDVPLRPCPAAMQNYIELGPLSAGAYRVERYVPGSPPNAPADVLNFTVTVRKNPSTPSALNGLWVAPDMPGWAISINRDPGSGNIFAAWYAHESVPGAVVPTWIVSPEMTMEERYGGTITLSILSGDLYRARANRSFFDNSLPVPFSIIGTDKVGKISIQFDSYAQATLTYDIAANLLDTAVPATFPRHGTLSLRKFVY